ncbi:SrfA family protein [Acerihabitans sp. TG2]|uniref:SrfA family protein n=1 Tax=Acerihabitans sp. TG2 TaxID=3096008 RepID=UPI002B22C28C|nr:SrfA family protein [Acerihabitans sp. TG2]MEA9389319.1 SrfA family protein [Acerihabitans sp. TG2]
MAKLFLRSGSLDDIFALGENGQPVYASALQIRESLRLTRNQAIADCLAIPQPNETGDRIDWYSPINGKVMSWGAANMAQRATALSQLEDCLAMAADISQRALNADKTARQLFGALLANAIRFPDHNYVYLVGEKPVITFWGFISPQHKLSQDALASLRTPPQEALHVSFDTLSDEPELEAPPITLASQDVAPDLTTAVILPPATAKSIWRFRRYFVWLAGIMLLLFLVLQVRAWIIGKEPAPQESPLTRLPPKNRPISTAVTTPVPASMNAHSDVFSGDKVSSAASAATLPVPPSTNTVSAGVNQSTQSEMKQTTAATIPQTRIKPADTPPKHTDAEKAAVPMSKNSLSLSADAMKRGSIDFLNGTWRGILDVQDPLTGKQPSLTYQFKQGHGTVKIIYGAGITCRTNTRAGFMPSGNLVINSRIKAKCSDGSRYRMPEITCTRDENGTTDCTGSYNAETAFPMTIKREKE